MASARDVVARVRAVPELRASLVLAVGVLLVYLATGVYETLQTVSDGLYTAAPAWKLGQFQTLDIDGFPRYSIWWFEKDGHIRSDRFPGAILFATPFYAIGGSSTFSVAPAVWSAAVASALAVVALHRALLSIVRPVTALGAALLVAFGTSVWTVAGHSVWSHGPMLLGLAVGMWAMSRTHYVLAGLGFALAILSRPHSAVVAAVVGVWESIARRSPWPVVKVGAASALGLAGLLAWNRVNAGEWTLLPGTYGGRANAAVSTGTGGQASGSLWVGDLLAVTGSPLRGVLVLSPFLLLLLPGVVAAWRNAPAWVRSSAVGGLVYLAVQLAGNTWTGGYGYFGYRITLEPLVLAAPLLSIAWEHWTERAAWRRWTFAALAAVSVWWFTMAAQHFAGDPTKAYTWRDWDVTRAARQAGITGAVVAALFVLVLAWILRTYARNRAAAATPTTSKSGNAGPLRAKRGAKNR